jgi:hypothetical protein
MRDAAGLAPRLRTADLREIAANVGEDPLSVLERGVAWSDPCYVIVDGEERPLALFGVVPDADCADAGLVWLLGSEELVRHSFFVLRNSRTWIERLHQRYKVLWNYVDARNEVHIRWLKWCGFDFLRLVEQHGAEQRPFYEFRKVRDDNDASPEPTAAGA